MGRLFWAIEKSPINAIKFVIEVEIIFIQQSLQKIVGVFYSFYDKMDKKFFGVSMLGSINKFIQKNMSLIVVIVAAEALFFPITFAWTVSKITILLGIIMLGMGMTLKIEDFKFILQNPKNVLIGAIAQFTIMPLIAFANTKIFLFPPEIAIGIILVGACPGGTASNVMTFLAKVTWHFQFQ